MMNNYEWSRQSIPRRMHTVLEVSRLLGLGRHQTLRRLKASGLPYRTYTKRWQDATGKWYSRKATGIPQQTAAELIKQDIVGGLNESWKSLAKTIKMKNPAPSPILRDLIRSIHDIETDRPEFPLAPPRPIRLKKPTIPRFFRVVLGLRRKGSGIVGRG